MIALLLRLWLLLHPERAEGELLASTDRADLDAESAAEHLGAARAAGALWGVDAALLLAVAHHESRYRPETITREPGHRVSCGVGTPTPQRSCSPWELTLLGGYAAAAAHLRSWLDHYGGSEWGALTAYAGGSGLVLICRDGGHWVAPSGRDACDVAPIVRKRAALIRWALGVKP